MYCARGATAVNPRGREGYGTEQEERLMIQDGSASAGRGEEQATEEKAGIFSGRTLAALNSARVTVAAKPATKAPAGPLVAYDSDSD